MVVLVVVPVEVEAVAVDRAAGVEEAVVPVAAARGDKILSAR